MSDSMKDFELMRQIHAVLVQHFLDGKKQSQIASAMNLSTSKVNRLIAQGRRLGMVKIDIDSPFQSLVELENHLLEGTDLFRAVVTPSVSGSPETTLRQVGKAAGNHLVETLRDGDVIAVTGGRAVSAVVAELDVDRRFDVTVVPLTGGVQGKHYTDVNHQAAQLAARLGGKAVMIHAPLFAENRAQRDMLMAMTATKEVLDLARSANLALVGVGSIEPEGSSYYDLHPVPEADRKMLTGIGVTGEILAHLITEEGAIANYAQNSRLVAVSPHQLRRIPRVIGVAAGVQKARPILAAMNGKYLNSIILDEKTAQAVLENVKGKQNVA